MEVRIDVESALIAPHFLAPAIAAIMGKRRKF
jgi:hypothetical protein